MTTDQHSPSDKGVLNAAVMQAGGCYPVVMVRYSMSCTAQGATTGGVMWNERTFVVAGYPSAWKNKMVDMKAGI